MSICNPMKRYVIRANDHGSYLVYDGISLQDIDKWSACCNCGMASYWLFEREAHNLLDEIIGDKLRKKFGPLQVVEMNITLVGK